MSERVTEGPLHVSEPGPLEHAKRRLNEIVDKAVDTLDELLVAEEGAVRLGAAKTILDRVGLVPQTRINLTGELRSTHALDAELDVMLTEFIERKQRGLTEVAGRSLAVRAAPSAGEQPSVEEQLEVALAGVRTVDPDVPAAEGTESPDDLRTDFVPDEPA